VSIADANTHQMQVYVNGQLVRTMPVSLGMGGTTTGSHGETVDYWTRSGPHVVIGKTPVTHMSSATYGITDKNSKFYYDEDVKDTVQITYTGEYAHLADWNILQQGHVNTSHGCINIGPANAIWFYNLSQTGDVIDVKNTPRELKATESPGGWNESWSDWTAGSAD
jgi:lipoprotein-anchoring transpeptidase ErfK/SrfK